QATHGIHGNGATGADATVRAADSRRPWADRRPSWTSRLIEHLDAEVSHDRAQLSEVALRLLRERNRGMADPADLDRFGDVEWDGDDLGIEVVADDARRDGVAIEPDHEVEDGRTVRDADLLRARQRGEDLLGEVERVVHPLVEREPRQTREIIEGD